MVSNPARCQLIRGTWIFPCSRSRLRIETGSVVPSRVSPLILHIKKAEPVNCACLKLSSSIRKESKKAGALCTHLRARERDTMMGKSERPISWQTTQLIGWGFSSRILWDVERRRSRAHPTPPPDRNYLKFARERLTPITQYPGSQASLSVQPTPLRASLSRSNQRCPETPQASHGGLEVVRRPPLSLPPRSFERLIIPHPRGH